jgi:2',3'-cyclic-nucleotide 2'-phosphodiesterase/3'-nucleotidase
MQYIDEKDTIVPKALHQWKFIPEEWTVPAAKRDGRLLFNRE